MKSRVGVKHVFLLAALIVLFVGGSARLRAQSTPCQTAGKICILTWQQDAAGETCTGCAYRTGENLSEATITYSSIKTDSFGQLCSYHLDGQVYSQPLVVTNVTFPNQGTFDAVYVVTQNNTLYAMNASPGSGSCSLIKSQSISTLLPQGEQTAVSCRKIGGKDCATIGPTVGILGTPVIQTTSTGGTIYR